MEVRDGFRYTDDNLMYLKDAIKLLSSITLEDGYIAGYCIGWRGTEAWSVVPQPPDLNDVLRYVFVNDEPWIQFGHVYDASGIVSGHEAYRDAVTPARKVASSVIDGYNHGTEDASRKYTPEDWTNYPNRYERV